ncbi:methylcobamide--CoM methyltransferase [Clostridium sp. MSJ-4]|uniref:Methylcobamide--CoM methyltransferase n=1 Tax=Clostridium simiarum TaxID=2841506 RepID=A0ABS6EZ44_9CLOT|nr:uroporphyrinogen decarboxylase family protein [Clostridium simiarum]MBU5591493.1 methylcobamide--CoM methyltransferase [Clostridium simiarum]
MMYQRDFKCVLDDKEEIPTGVMEEFKVKFPEVHFNEKEMVALSKAIKEANKEDFCILPFCMTLEAEALGAVINLGDEKMGPRVSAHTFTNFEDLKKLSVIDINKGRIAKVLSSVEILKSYGEQVILKVQGPFTIINSLIEPRIFYKAIRKNKEEVEKIMGVIEESIALFIEEGIKRGADIISYGDSAGTMDVLGPKMYKAYSGRYNYNVLKRVQDKINNSIIHICGITSSSLAKAEFIESKEVLVPKDITYSEALNWIIKERKDIKIIGHNCLRKANKKLQKPIVWEIHLGNTPPGVYFPSKKVGDL